METAHRFGRDGHLAGVVSAPEDGSASDLAVVIPNAGFIHHVGPWQLHVELARRLAAAGVPTLRFDLSGLGDSEVPRRRESVTERKQGDIRDALELVAQECGARRFVMAGLCSGAVDSHQAAQDEASVVGAALLDPPAYPDLRYHVIYWTERLLNPPRVFNFLRRKLGSSRTGAGPVAPAPAPGTYQPMPAETFAAQIEAAALRGAEYLFIYTRDEDYKHRRQLFSILTPNTPRERVSVYHYPNLEHTPVLIEDRHVIAETLLGWIEDRFL